MPHEQVRPQSLIRDIRVLGFAIFLLLFGLLDFPSIAPACLDTGTFSLLISLFPAAYMLPILLATLLAFACPRISHTALIAAGLASLLVGLAAFTAELLSGYVSIQMSVLPVLGNGIGVLCGFAAWLMLFEKEKMPLCVCMMLVSHLLEACAQVLLLPPLSPWIYCGLVLLLIIAHGFLLMRCTHRYGAGFGAGAATEAEADDREVGKIVARKGTRTLATILRELWQPLLCVAVLGFSLAVLRTVASQSIDPMYWSNALPATGKLLGVALFALLWFRSNRFIRSNKLYVLLYSLVLLLIVLLPIIGVGYATVFMVVCGGIFNLAYLIALITCVGLLRERVASALAVCGILFTVMYAFVLLGEFVGRYTRGDAGYDSAGLLLVAFLVALLVSLANLIISMLQGKNPEAQKAQQARDTAMRPTVTFAPEEELRNNTHLTKVYGLSDRELDVLILLLGARSVPAIAGALFISENTVKSHTKSIYRKLDIHNRQELLALTALILSEDTES